MIRDERDMQVLSKATELQLRSLALEFDQIKRPEKKSSRMYRCEGLSARSAA